MEAEGVVFHCNVHVGKDVSAKELEAQHDAVLLAGGSEQPFDFFAKAPGRDLDGIHFAMDFLPQQNRRVAGRAAGAPSREITAKDKHVIVIGGGDTGSDCIGTSFRQGAKSVTQLEIMPMPPEKENKALSWPHWPLKLRVSSQPGRRRQGRVLDLDHRLCRRERQGRRSCSTRASTASLKPVPGQRGRAAGRPRAVRHGLLRAGRGRRRQGAGLAGRAARALQGPRRQRARLPHQGRARRCSPPATSAAARSLVVWAIREGRQAAHAIDRFLMGRSDLPR